MKRKELRFRKYYGEREESVTGSYKQIVIARHEAIPGCASQPCIVRDCFLPRNDEEEWTQGNPQILKIKVPISA